MCNFNTEPVACGVSAKAAEGEGGLDEYPQLYMLMYLISKHCGADSATAEAAGVEAPLRPLAWKVPRRRSSRW